VAVTGCRRSIERRTLDRADPPPLLSGGDSVLAQWHRIDARAWVDTKAVIACTRRWISSLVIGLNLCPFARRVFEADTIRFVVSDARDGTALLKVLAGELTSLTTAPAACVETTLLIHPHALAAFLDYVDFLDTAESLVGDLGLRGVMQIASFHPEYQFAGTRPDDVENFTNRSPYPMLHLLREDSISAVAADPEALLEIPRRNGATLRSLGREKLLEMLKAVGDGLGGPPQKWWTPS
jgi:hypothetical protein